MNAKSYRREVRAGWIDLKPDRYDELAEYGCVAAQREAPVEQRRESPRRTSHVERHAQAGAEAIRHANDHAWMHGEVDVQRLILNDRHQLQVEGEAVAPVERDSRRKANHKIVGDRGRRAVCASDQRNNKSEMPPDSILSGGGTGYSRCDAEDDQTDSNSQ